MREIKLTRGYDIPLKGAASGENLQDLSSGGRFALLPPDFDGVKFRLCVKEGERVKAGSPILRNKAADEQVFAAPAGGVVEAVIRGERRSLQAIVIRSDGEEEFATFRSWTEEELRKANGEELISHLGGAGVLAEFRERPFNFVASATHRPRDIFVCCFESAPLAPDLSLFLKGQEAFFRAGLLACSRLTSGKVYVTIRPEQTAVIEACRDLPQVEVCAFRGPHPAGEPGVQIHHLAPVKGREDIVWWLRLPGLVRLGRFLLEGKIYPYTLLSIAGPGCSAPTLAKVRVGSCLDPILDGRGDESKPVRIVRGNVLTGRKAGRDGFLGLYEHQITLIPEAVEPEFMGWARPGFRKKSWYPTFLGNLLGGEVGTDTRLHGGHRAFIFNDVYEDVVPMEILPIFLIKSCIYQDIEEMEQHGIYEVCEEDIALCEYICPSKTPFQKILREAINFVEKEG